MDTMKKMLQVESLDDYLGGIICCGHDDMLPVIGTLPLTTAIL